MNAQWPCFCHRASLAHHAQSHGAIKRREKLRLDLRATIWLKANSELFHEAGLRILDFLRCRIFAFLHENKLLRCGVLSESIPPLLHNIVRCIDAAVHDHVNTPRQDYTRYNESDNCLNKSIRICMVPLILQLGRTAADVRKIMCHGDGARQGG